jgi:hypothetical protein
MKNFGKLFQSRTWFIALPLTALLAAARPNVSLAVTVLSTIPNNGAANVQTSTNGINNILTGTAVTATFSEPMNPATIDSTAPGALLTFTLKDVTGNNVLGTVAMNATSTVATFTPAGSALTPNRNYTATVTVAARNEGGIAMTNPVQWNFTTDAIPYTGQAPVALGTAGTFAILTKTGVTDVYASAVTGDVGTSPITGAALHLTCGEVAGMVYTVDAAGPLPCSTTSPTLLTAAIGDLGLAYNDAAGRTSPDFTELGAGEIGGLTLVPGLYKWALAS